MQDRSHRKFYPSINHIKFLSSISSLDTLRYIISATITKAVLTITLHDVLLGNVWICLGQSVMEMSITDSFNRTEEIANVDNYLKIQLVTAAFVPSATPL